MSVPGPEVRLATPGFFLQPDYHEVLAWLREHSPVHTTDDGLVRKADAAMYAAKLAGKGRWHVAP